jgi:FkbM family methyltransferase
MREFYGWHFPDIESHFPQMLKKSVDRGGPAEYQWLVRKRSIELCLNRGRALDIGANVGLWSRDLVNHFDHVIAFEPVEIFRQCLQKNVTANNLEIKDVALGDQETQASMIITPGNTGHSHLDPTSFGSGNIKVVRLDSLELVDVDYIKIDCEGYEYRILQGAQKTIQTCRPIIVVEQKPHDAYSDQYGQFAAVDLLQQWGMRKLDQVKDDWILGW